MSLAPGYNLGSITADQLNELLRKRYPDNEAQHLIIIVLWLVITFDTPPLQSEIQYIERVSETWDIDLDKLFSLIHVNLNDVLAAALELVIRFLPDNDKRIMLVLCINACLVDGDMNYDEHMMLRLICDAARITPDEFAVMYRKITNADLPSLGDPSSNAFYFQMN